LKEIPQTEQRGKTGYAFGRLFNLQCQNIRHTTTRNCSTCFWSNFDLLSKNCIGDFKSITFLREYINMVGL